MAATFVQTVAEVAGNKNSAVFYSRHKKSSAIEFFELRVLGMREMLRKTGRKRKTRYETVLFCRIVILGLLCKRQQRCQVNLSEPVMPDFKTNTNNKNLFGQHFFLGFYIL